MAKIIKGNFDQLIENVYQTHCILQENAQRNINQNLTIRNWLVGYYIVEYEQHGQDRATYGENLIGEIASKLKEKELKGFSISALKNHRTFYLRYPQISQSVIGLLQSVDNQLDVKELKKSQSLISQLDSDLILPSELILSKLTYTHFIELFRVEDPLERLFYEVETIKNNWSVRTVSIKDQAWYPYEWKNDPTIQSMLVMIDAIHEKFDNQSDLWKSLVSNKNISFYFLPLAEMGLTDDLYIKMNSRGKPLTPFEHFKAESEETIKHISEELSTEINHKFDINWTDMLFPFRGNNNIIDDEFMRYFHFISDIITYKSSLNLERDEFRVACLLYSNENQKAKENILYLINSFDCWYKIDILNFFEGIFSKNTYQNTKVKIYQDDLNIFKECLDNYGEYSGRNRRFPLNKMLLLYSVIIYLQNKESISEDQFRRRIRIIRNLIWNSTDEIRDDRMKTLLNESETIILSGEIPLSESGELGYNVRQKEEERKKNGWLIDNVENEDELYHLEDHSLLKGCVSIVDMDSSSNFRKFRVLFNNYSKDLINRALLTIGDYSQFISWRFQFGARYNDSVWFDLFHPTKQRSGFENSFKIINSLLSSLEESNINDDYLEKIVGSFLDNQNTPKDWRYYFVKYNLMRQGNFGMYYWKNISDRNYDVIMMNTEKSIGGKNWNVFLYTLDQQIELLGRLSLGDYAYQGNKLKIINTDYEIECQNEKYVVSQNGLQTEYPIQQIGGIDTEDRIERGKQIICELLGINN